MAELKTIENEGSVLDFINGLENHRRKEDSLALLALLADITEKPAKMWGKSIVGFGSYHYRYDSGREGDWFMCGFSPKIQNITIYIMQGFGKYDQYLENLGKYKKGNSCLYLSRLSDVDMNILELLIRQSVKDIEEGAVSLTD